MNCEGKPNLRSVYLKISTNISLREAHTTFYFDRDYDHDIEGLDCARCFITEGYSVENYYVLHDAFNRVLRSAFFMDQVYHELDQQCVTEIMAIYRRLQCEYHRKLLLFNAWALAQRRREVEKGRGRINLSVFDGHRLFALDLERVEARYTLEELNARFPEQEPLAEREIEEAKQWFQGRTPRLAFRGKQEAQFLTSILVTLSDLAARACPPFSRKIPCRLRISPSEIVGDLSQFADTSDRLRRFLREYRDRITAAEGQRAVSVRE